MNAACERYTSILGVKPPKAMSTPFSPDCSLHAADDEVRGELAKELCSVRMKDLWAARLPRPDLTKAIMAFASKISKFTRNHDRIFHRLTCYMWTTQDYERRVR